MDIESRWTLRYVFAALVTLFAGPLLSTLPPIDAVPFMKVGQNGFQPIWVLAEGISLVVLWVLAMHAHRTWPDNGSGFSFLRQLIIPVTLLLTLIATDRTLRILGVPLIERIGPHHYTLAYAAGLTLAGLWITIGWLSNLDALSRFFSATDHERHREALQTTEQETGEHYTDELGSKEESSTPVCSTHPEPPTMLGRYKILKELGRGAMGVVYLGKDPTIQRFVAIKTMRLDNADDHSHRQEIRTRFLREAESTGRLSHPNIVTIFDAGEQENLSYIAMELLHGSTLKEWSRAPNLMPPDKLIPILATVADAMDYAHQQGVVHCDIKPANIMLTEERVVKVMDFGIAKMASSSKTTTETVMGTPTYMSPEQIAGKKVDGRSDIFSLGVVMFELLTGYPPFTGDTVPAVLFAIANTPHPRLAALRPDLPPFMQDIIDRALQKHPAHRYRRAGEFAHDLRACIEKFAA